MDEALDLECRRRIYERIAASPGVHFRELQRLLDIPVGMLDYHLKYMEKRGLVSTKTEGHYTRYFAARRFDAAAKEALSFLRQELPRAIILYLIQHPGATHGQILDVLDVTGATLSYHVKRMEKAGILRSEKRGRESALTVVDAEKLADLIVTYRRSFVDNLVDSFVSAWLSK